MKPTLKKYKLLIESIIVAIFFGIVFLEHATLFKVIASLLSVIVIWEVVRMLASYIFEDAKVMRIRLIIDGFIIFFLRDLVLIFQKKNILWN